MTGYVAFAQTPNDKKLMKRFIDCPDCVRRVVITDNQVAIVRWIIAHEESDITARMLSDDKGITIQSASKKLSHLWKAGYLRRETGFDLSGGVMYRYRLAI